MKSLHRLLLLLWAIGALHLPLVVADPGWVWQNPRPQGNPLLGVALLDEQTVVAVGGAGTVMKSTDGGGTWTVQHSVARTTNDLRAVAFVEADIGTAVGRNGTILRTTTGGQDTP